MINYNNNLINLCSCRSKIDTEKLRRRIASSSVHPSISRRRRPAGDTMDRKTWCTNFNLRRLFRAGPAAVSHLLLRLPPPAAAALRRRTSALSAASGRKRRRRSDPLPSSSHPDRFHWSAARCADRLDSNSIHLDERRSVHRSIGRLQGIDRWAC